MQNIAMKFIFTISVRLFICLGLLAISWYGYEEYIDDHSVSTAFLTSSKAYTEDLLYDKTLKFAGLKLLLESDIASSLPLDKSVAWWLFNRSKIEIEMESHSLIADTSIERCAWWKFACFSLQVKERVPTFIALSDKNAWVVADDGAFITPIPPSRIEKAMFKRPDGEYVEPPVVDGLFVGDDNPELSRARSVYINNAILEIEKDTGRSIEKVSIRDNGELEILLRESSFLIVFDKSYGEVEKLKDQIVRFNKIMEQFKGRERTIASIDLAFNSLAVVRLKKGENPGT